jgi:16S rRNA (adenine1518-N6/adenine1519-N6)-dimethyltransferase
MPLYRPSELQKFLSLLGIFPKKQLSQNFLIDGNILKKIARFADLRADDYVIEIGPGPGALTEHLLGQGASVLAIEKDATFAEALSRLAPQGKKLEIVTLDFLDFPLVSHLAKKALPRQTVKVIANIPYHLTSPIIEKIIEARAFIHSATLMVQHEVARRLVAPPKSPDMSSLTIFAGFYADIHFGFVVPPKCFYPPPKVDSAVVRLDLHMAPSGFDEERFFELVRAAFGQRRKMLTSSLRKFASPDLITTTLSSLSISPKARPEELSCAEWIQLFTTLSHALPG